jgi:hypothetical protein
MQNMERILKACDILADALRAHDIPHGHITIEIGTREFEEMTYHFDALNLRPVNPLGRQWNEPAMIEYKQVFRFKAVILRERMTPCHMERPRR